MLWNKSEVLKLKRYILDLNPQNTCIFLTQPIQTAYTCIYCSTDIQHSPPFFFLKDRYGTIHSSMLLLQLSSMVTLKVSRQTLTWSGHGKSTRCRRYKIATSRVSMTSFLLESTSRFPVTVVMYLLQHFAIIVKNA